MEKLLSANSYGLLICCLNRKGDTHHHDNFSENTTIIFLIYPGLRQLSFYQEKLDIRLFSYLHQPPQLSLFPLSQFTVIAISVVYVLTTCASQKVVKQVIYTSICDAVTK